MNGDTRPRVDYTKKDFNALLEDMLALAQERLPAWTDHSPNDPGRVLYELAAHAVDLQLYYVDRLANESYLETAVEARSLVNLLRLIGYELRPPKPGSADLTLFFDPAAVGAVTIPTGARFETSAKFTGRPVPFQYTRPPLIISVPGLPLTSYQSNSYRTFTGLPVVQVDGTVGNEVLGSSDGSPSQRFRLARQPLIDGSLTVLVDEGAGPRTYEVRESLLQSAPTDRHVSVRRDELDVAWVEFGNLKYARIPPRLRNNLMASYLVGGGEKGNVPAASIVTAVSAIQNLKKVTNPDAASGGTDREPLVEAATRAPRQFRSRGRAVTAEDYESHALQFGVGKARARAASWNRIELFVAPAGGGYPSDTLKEDLRAYFESRRILTSLLDINDPVYVRVAIEGILEVEPYFFTQQIVTRVQDAVAALLAFPAVDFAATLYLSKVYEAIEAIEGVRAVAVTRFSRDDGSGPALPGDGRILLGWDEIPVAASSAGMTLIAVTGGAA
jgi:hypothetical protein